MIPSFNYKIPKTLQEACDLLWEAGGKAKIIAGGTDLVIGLRNGVHKPNYLIDITKIEELRRIDEKDGKVSIGAAVTHSEIASSPVVKKYGKVLSDAAAEIGSPQIRNLGTIGGNIINASPAADTIPPLMVLNAIGRVMSKKGERDVPLFQLFKGPYETNLKPHEILAQVKFQKLSFSMKSSFIRVARRGAMAIARMSVVIILQMEDGEDWIKDIRVSVGAITPTHFCRHWCDYRLWPSSGKPEDISPRSCRTMPRCRTMPQRMSEAEAVLKGKLIDEELLRKASIKVSEAMIHRSGVRPSTSYKAPMIEALFMMALREALEEQP